MDVVRLGFISLFYALGFGLVLFFLPFLAYAVSPNIFVIGFLVAVPALASLLTALPAGNLIDSFGRRKMVLAGMGLMLLVALSLPYASSLAGFILFACFFGVASQLIYSSLKVYLFDLAPRGSTSKYFGIVAAAFQLGLAFGPVVGGYLVSEGFMSGLVAASRFFSLDVLVLLLFFVFWGFGKVKAPLVKVKYTLGNFLFDGAMDYLSLGRVGAVVLGFTILFTTYEGLIWTLEPLFARYYAFGAFSVGLIMSMFLIPFILFNVPAGMVADRFGKAKVLPPSLVVTGVFLVLFGLSEQTSYLMLFAFLSTTGLAFAWISAAGLLADASRKSKTGGIVGVWNASEEIGYIIGPILGGLIAQYSNIRVPMIVLGGIMVVSALALVLTRGKRI